MSLMVASKFCELVQNGGVGSNLILRTIVNPITNAQTVTEVPPSDCTLPKTDSNFVVRNVDNIPLTVYIRFTNNHKFYVGVGGNTAGTGLYTEFLLRSNNGGNSFAGGSNSFAKLSNGGYGVHYTETSSPSGRYTVYSHTTDVTGTGGWQHQIISPVGSARLALTGVDGTGRVFLAQSSNIFVGISQITILRGADASGTAFSAVASIVVDAQCTSPAANTRRSIILSDNTPAFIFTCQDQRLFFAKSSIPSAAGPWVIQEIVSGDMWYDARDSYESATIHMTEGVNKPHIVYVQLSTYSVIFIQSLFETKF
jgi:hypothetical protein